MRVLICIEALGIGGKERQAVQMIRGLAHQTGIEFRVICLDGDDFYLPELASAGITIEFLPRRRRWDIGLFYKLQRIIRKYRPHIIHTNGLMSSFYTLPLARLMRIPLINGSIRNAFSNGGFRWSLEKLLLTASNYRVANSHAGLRSRGFSEDQTQNVVIHNGFDFTRLENVTRNRGQRVDARDTKIKTVGMVAEFNRYKDYSTFIQAAVKITARRKDVVFITVGDGENLSASEKLAAGVETIKFLRKRKNVEEIIDTFDIGVLCTFVEGLSNSIMEYMALRKPVVATDGGGTRELVVDGKTGFLVPPENPDALAAKIEYLLDDPATAQRMGELGEARLRREFSMTKMVEATVRLYHLAVANSTGNRLSYDWRAGGAES